VTGSEGVANQDAAGARVCPKDHPQQRLGLPGMSITLMLRETGKLPDHARGWIKCQQYRSDPIGSAFPVEREFNQDAAGARVCPKDHPQQRLGLPGMSITLTPRETGKLPDHA